MMALLPALQRLAAAMLVTVLAALAGPLPALAQTGAQTKAEPKAQSKPGAKQTAAARARALLRAGRPVAALEALHPAVTARPNDLTLLFLVGRAGIAAAGRKGIDDKARTVFLDAAISALRRMLVIRPGLVRARLELARAFFLKQDDTLARRHFERVLAGKPPPAVVANVNRYLGAIRARKRWSAYFGFALAPDTNVGAASDADTVWLPAFGTVLPFRVNEDSQPSSGIGLLVWGGGEYQHPLPDLWGRKLRLRVGGDLWRQEYAHSRFDRTLFAGHAGPRWLAGRTWEFSLLGSARQTLSAGEPEYSELGLRLEAAQRLGPRLFARETASWHQRTYEDSGGLNGPRWQGSLNLSWQATPTLSVGANAGYSAEAPRAAHQRNTRPWVQVSANYALPWGFTVGASANVYRTTYDSGPYWRVLTRGDARRVDRGQSFRLSLLNRAFTLGGFSPQLIAIYEERRSNAQLSSYKRFRGELRAVRQF
ncbi:MAG: surface lipoprotein assembly modifier [Rhodospirillaceae bacterium]|nr:surface lipoprotein assembly modifier [Rhodospirillaceae bacterium]